MLYGYGGAYVGDVPVIGPLSDGSFIPAMHLHDGPQGVANGNTQVRNMLRVPVAFKLHLWLPNVTGHMLAVCIDGRADVGSRCDVQLWSE